MSSSARSGNSAIRTQRAPTASDPQYPSYSQQQYPSEHQSSYHNVKIDQQSREMYSQAPSLPRQRHAAHRVNEGQEIPAQQQKAQFQYSNRVGTHDEMHNSFGQGQRVQRDYQYDARYRGNGDMRSQSSLGGRYDNVQRSRDAGQILQQSATDRRPKPRDRILAEPESPVTLSWDNPFGAFPTKKPNAADKKPEHAGSGTDPRLLNRPQTSQDHRRREEPYGRPQTAQDHQRRNETYSRPQTSQDHRREDLYNRPHTSQGHSKAIEEPYNQSSNPRGHQQRAETISENPQQNAAQSVRSPPIKHAQNYVAPDQSKRNVSRPDPNLENQAVSGTRRPFPERNNPVDINRSNQGYNIRQDSHPRTPLPADQNHKDINKQTQIAIKRPENGQTSGYSGNSSKTQLPQQKVLENTALDRAHTPLPSQQNKGVDLRHGTSSQAQISTTHKPIPVEPDMPLRKFPPNVVRKDLNAESNGVASLPVRPNVPQRSVTQPAPGDNTIASGYGGLAYEPRAVNHVGEQPSTAQASTPLAERRPSAPAYTQRYAKQISEERFDPSSYRGVPLNKQSSHQSSEMPNFDSITTPVNEKSEALFPIAQKSQSQAPEQPAYVKQTYQSPTTANTTKVANPPKASGSVRIPIDRSTSSSQVAPGRFDKLASNEVSFDYSQSRDAQLRKGSATSVTKQKPTAEELIYPNTMPASSAASRSLSQEQPTVQNETSRFPPRNASKFSSQEASNDASRHWSHPSEQIRSHPSTFNDVYDNSQHYDNNGSSRYAYDNAFYDDDDHTHDYYDPAQEMYTDRTQYYNSQGDHSSHEQNVAQQQTSGYYSGNAVRPGTSDSARSMPVRTNYDSSGTSSNVPLVAPHIHSAHPVPIRPGLMNNMPQPASAPAPAASAPMSASVLVRAPVPIRAQASINNAPVKEATMPQVAPADSKERAVTIEELNKYREAYRNEPNDYPLGLKFVKRLVEAATVLASENGRADAKQTAKNRERYILDAHKLVKKLVGAGYVDAMFYLADCHGQGLLGLAQDPKEAFQLYQSAAKLGHPQSAYRVAVCCEMGNEEGGGTRRDPAKAFQWYKRAATLGDTPAMYKMGIVLLKGLLGQPRNPREAVSWLKRAAERAEPDNPHALHELALLYESAQSTDHIVRDEKYALQLFTQAADLGYKYSQFRLGSAYEYGLLGCPTDPRQSITWYSRAAAQGEHQSELALSGWYLTGSPPLLAQSDSEAFLWARKAAMSGLARAEYAMGYFTEVGIGTSSDLEEAKRWYYRAAAQNLPKAKERLEDLRRGGKMTKTRVSRSNVEKNGEGECIVM